MAADLPHDAGIFLFSATMLSGQQASQQQNTPAENRHVTCTTNENARGYVGELTSLVCKLE